MPLYEYECVECGRRTEVLQKYDDQPLAACPSCGGAVRKLISSPAFQFKGTGWYATDYAAKKAPAGEGAESKPDQKSAPKEGTAGRGEGSSSPASGSSSSSSGESKAAPSGGGGSTGGES